MVTNINKHPDYKPSIKLMNEAFYKANDRCKQAIKAVNDILQKARQ